MLTDEELDAIEARASAATEGPWVRRFIDSEGDYIDAPDGHVVAEATEWHDADFITRARADVPVLVAEGRTLRTALDALVRAAAFVGTELYLFQRPLNELQQQGFDALYAAIGPANEVLGLNPVSGERGDSA